MTPKINLAIQILMGLALLLGMVLARQRRFRAHGICQSAVVLLNLIPIASFMVAAFHKAALPALPKGLNDRFYAVATAHAALGMLAELLGLYVILSAGLKLLPPALRFKNYKRWMRTELVLWWLVILIGIGTYWVWNVSSNAQTTATVETSAPVSAASAAQPPTAPTVTINIGNFAFTPREVQIEVGTIVVWKNTVGRHTITADDNSFDSPIMAPGEEFKHTFDHSGKVQYFCKLHGAAGGHDMAGVVVVK